MTFSSALLSPLPEVKQGMMFAKEWDPLFSRPRKLNDNRFFVETRREMFGKSLENDDGTELSSPDDNPDNNGIRILLHDFDDSTALIEVNHVDQYCQNVSLAALESGMEPVAGNRRAAWVDDRQRSRRNDKWFREYQNPLTATSLLRLLKKPRFDEKDTPDANRRLIYIRNLDKWFILALAETALSHEVTALRDAIGNHLRRQISIRVHIATRRYAWFQLDLHLPYFELRPDSTSQNGAESDHIGPKNGAIDLSFLDLLPMASSARKKFVMHEACFSFVMCGADEQHPVGYCFVNRDFQECEDLEDMEFAYQGVHEDPIASDCGENVVDANLPIWDPRAYFLIIFELRIAKLLKEWNGLEQLIGSKINSSERHTSSILSSDSNVDKAHHNQKAKEALDWHRKTMDLLAKLLNVLEETVKAWDVFRAPEGDSGYFGNVGSTTEERRNNMMALRAINDTFESLRTVHGRFISSQNQCQRMAQNLHTDLTLRFTAESNAASQMNVSTTEWTISVFSPIALTIAYFSMPQDVIPFRLNFHSWLIALLVITAIVRFLFYLFGGRFRQSWLCKKVASAIKAAKFRGSMPTNFYSLVGYSGYVLAAFNSLPRRRPSPVDPSVEGVELHELDIADRA